MTLTLRQASVTGAVTAGRALTYAEMDANWTFLAQRAFVFACGAETALVTTGLAKVTLRLPHAFQVTAVRASVTSAATSGTVTADINEAGISILSTKLTIDATETTSTSAAASAVISDASLADDALITIDVDDAGSGDATGLKVTLIGYIV